MRIEPLLLVTVLCAAPALAEEEVAPSLELLDFLGSFETSGGQWLDPTELAATPAEEQPPQDAGGQEE